MRPRNTTILVMLVGLLLVAFAAGIAQTPAQGDQKKKAESCCAKESGCCSEDSCPTKAEGTTTADAANPDSTTADAKKSDCCSGESCEMKDMAGTKTDTGDHSCCGESCDMKHDANMKHDATMKHDMKDHKGDCCNIKQKNKTKNKKAA